MKTHQSIPRPTPDLWQRFWAKVDKTETCWLWTASRNQQGYGQFAIRPKVYRAHRMAYTWLVGPIPDGLVLDHLCRVRECLNPAHLEPVTHKTNLTRGVGPTGTKARQTHCIYGHEFTPENTNIKKNGCRECRACVTRKSSDRWKTLKASKAAAA